MVGLAPHNGGSEQPPLPKREPAQLSGIGFSDHVDECAESSAPAIAYGASAVPISANVSPVGRSGRKGGVQRSECPGAGTHLIESRGGGFAVEEGAYPIQFSVDYPARQLDRMTTFFRILTAIPILIVLSTVSGAATSQTTYDGRTTATVVGAGGLLVVGPVLMILFRRKYPRWWFDWNLELMRFANRVGIYLALMDDRYPSTDERQSVHLDFPYPDAARDLNRWLPLVKWFLAIPHYVVLFFLWIAALVLVVIAWFAILFTGRFPQGMFGFVEGVIRWQNRVIAYAFTLVTDRYPPFRLAP